MLKKTRKLKKKDIPQDKTHLTKFTKEVLYAKNNEGHYEKLLSKGWNVKNDALDNAWEDLNEQIEESLKNVLAGKISPIDYFMKLRIMDLDILASYTGIWKFFIKRHFRPEVFKKLKTKTLDKYAKAFDITTEELKNFGKTNH